MGWIETANLGLAALLVGCGPAAGGGEETESDGPVDTDGPQTASAGPGSGPSGSGSGETSASGSDSSGETGSGTAEPVPEPEPGEDGWFLFVGGPVDGDEPPCIYEHNGDTAMPLFCPEASDEGVAIVDRERLGRSPTTIAFTVEIFALDVYPEQLWMVDLADGTATLVDEHDADPNGGPRFDINGVISLSPYEAVVTVRTDSGLALMRVDDSGTYGPNLLPDGYDATLVGRLGNSVVLQSFTNGAEVLAVDLDGGGVTSLSADFEGSAVAAGISPTNDAVLFTAYDNGWSAMVSDGDELHRIGSVPGGGIEWAAWLGPGEVVVTTEVSLLRWDTVDGSAPDELGDLAAGTGPAGEGVLVPGGVAFRDAGGGVGWVVGSELADPCATAGEVGNLRTDIGGTNPRVLVDDADPYTPAANGSIAECRPGEAAVDLLESLDLVGYLF